ncbi:MAG: NUDIX hydrolase, partial [Candidatus Nitrotoga sp.]
MDLKETRLDSKAVYEGDFIKVFKDSVQLPDGSVSSREHIVHRGAVAILAILDNGNLLMERQY